ncbi:MAG: NAD(P)-binding protein, partial [Lachnospiraceae bacterium]|nr:NAD(P)-binding protein [Lachnospiraceae bacterium]
MELIHHYPHVFTPIKVGPLTLKNRLQFSPTVSCMSTAYGEVTTEYVDFIGMQARTGVGLITIGATSVDEETGSDFPGELNITRDEMIGGLSRIADAAHRYGAKISAEMCHSGRGADKTLLQTPYALAPTPIPLDDKCRFVKAMDQHEIDHVVNQYADCAERLMKAGFDMCMVHAAHGNLIGQFLSPATNHRVDNYGGCKENRWRFALEILQAMRARVGNKMAIEMRISGDEMQPNGMRVDDTIDFLKVAQQYVDMVVVSRGLIVDYNYSFYPQPPYYHPYCHNVYLAEPIKKALNIPVSVVGSIKNLDMAEEILSSGKADIIAMARALFADPDLVHKGRRTGSQESVKPCLRCLQVCNNNTDYGRPVSCAITPWLGLKEYQEIVPAPVKKKAVVVGGGVAGMMAAQTLRKRGHDVVLFEAQDHLGGHLVNICHLQFKDDMRQYAKWDVN